MKRIVNGVTYNTDTSTRIARSEWEADDGAMVGTLYQTRGGAFYVHKQLTKQVWNEHSMEQEERIIHEVEPLSQTDAHAWMMDGVVEAFSNPFEDPPEAAAEAEPGATLYIRVPASLKKRVDDAAKEGEISGNVWAMRCVEQCLADAEKSLCDYKPLAYLWHIASNINSFEDGEWSKERLLTAVARIRREAEKLAEQLGVSFEDFAGGWFEGDIGFLDLRKEFEPYPDPERS